MKLGRWFVFLPLFTLGAVVVSATACGGDSDGSGACEEVYGDTGARWCHNFHSTDTETGEEICARIGGEWTGGSSCADLGYTRECYGGEWVKPSGSCL